MSGIFISYRRDDSRGTAGRLYDDLKDHFGKDRVFRDLDAVEPGADYAVEIDGFIESCEAFVVVIGNQWLDIRDDEGRRRLFEADDLVHKEVAAALATGRPVIPVTVEDAPMPSAAKLPQELAQLARRNVLPLSDSRWDYDVGRLLRRLEEVVPASVPAAPPPGIAGGGTPGGGYGPAGAGYAAGHGYARWGAGSSPPPGGPPTTAGGWSGGHSGSTPGPAGPPPPSATSGGRGRACVLGGLALMVVLALVVVVVLAATPDGPGDEPTTTTAPTLGTTVPPPVSTVTTRPVPTVTAPPPVPGGETTVTLSRSSGPVGTAITVSGSGFAPNETVEIRFHARSWPPR